MYIPHLLWSKSNFMYLCTGVTITSVIPNNCKPLPASGSLPMPQMETCGRTCAVGCTAGNMQHSGVTISREMYRIRMYSLENLLSQGQR